MRLAKMIFVMVAWFGPMTAQAVEVDLGVETQTVYDSNVFRTGGDHKQDASFRFGPTVRINQQGDKLGFDLRYKPLYEAFSNFTDANNLSHALQNDVSYRFSNRTDAELHNQFQVVNVLNFSDPNTIDQGTTPTPDNDIQRDEMFLFDSTFNLHHAISPRWATDTELAFNLFDPRGRRLTVGSKSVSAFQTLSYARNASDTFGVGVGAIAQLFDEVEGLPASNSYIARAFGTYTRHFGESTTLSLRAGPALIITDQSSASGTSAATFPFVPVDSDTTVGALRGQGIPIADSFFQGLTNDTPIAAGSVVVPNPFSCVDVAANDAGIALLQGSGCSFQLVLRSDIPGEQEALGSVRSSQTQVTVSGSNAGSNDAALSLFGEASLTHRWTPNLFSELTYNRSQSPARGLGSTAIADTISFLTVWRPSPLWDLSLRASYIKRKSPTDLSRSFLQISRDPDNALPTFGLVKLTGSSTVVEDSTTIDTDRWDVRLRVARRVTRHITVSGWASYSDQTSTITSRNPNDFSDFTVILGFKYDFDAFRL